MKKTGIINTRYNVHDNTRQMIKELAEENGTSMSAIVERAIHEMYDRDTVDENIILARQATLERKIGYLDKKLETTAGLFLYALPLLFAGLPQLPKDRDDRQTVLDMGTKRTEDIVNGYRRHTIKTGLSFMQSVYGDSLEELGESPKRNKESNGEKEHREK